MVHDTGAYVTVEGFTSGIGSVKRVPICTMAIAYDCPFDLITYILFFHQVLFIKDMDTNLLSPFQLRNFGVTVNEVPLQHLPSEQRDTLCHSIFTDNLHIPLTLKGTMSGFVSRKPTLLEVQDSTVPMAFIFT
jgi:hypothetical protein